MATCTGEFAMKRRNALVVLALLAVGMFGILAIPQRQTPGAPAYSCDSLNVEKHADGETFTFTPGFTAMNGAEFSGIYYDFGDGSTIYTKSRSLDHMYSTEGLYSTSVMIKVKVGSDEKIVTGNGCSFAFMVTHPRPVLSETPSVLPPELPRT